METQPPPGKVPGLCSLRYGLSILLHFCNLAVTAQRSCLNLTMVVMVNSSQPPGAPNSSARLRDSTQGPVYDWSPDMQGVIFSAIFYGLVLSQVPAGYLSGIVSIKKLVGSTLLLSSVLSLLTPLAAKAGEAAMILCRATQGLAQHELWVRWAPPLERTRLISIGMSGLLLGPFLVLLVTGVICDSLGWPMVFYVFDLQLRPPALTGACGCVLCLLWCLLFYDHPKDHPCMSALEKQYIVGSLAQQAGSCKQPLPIRAMLTSLPLWAVAVVSFAFFWTITLFITYTPKFVDDSLHVDMRKNGLLSGLPYLFSWVTGILTGQMADVLLSRDIFKILTIRKLFTTLGILLPSVFGLGLVCLSAGLYSTVTFLVLANATSSFSIGGMMVNILDLAPRYYGFLKGVTTLIGMVGGMLSSLLTGFILSRDPESPWLKTVLVMAGINLAAVAFYLVFAKADIQDWAKDRQTRL
ncbi:sodium-dependent phosphate transport protein 1 isoform X2 [Tupaia chinensis]|uniref:sodium-dependent phosphate transport protein 1 isoform X2 n=1 Tax=Tupaia chinensis TaxID=246437 RepID=UPI000FFBFA24|nr:sodium-dependent phosphate transport protein 1 isoform X2 [Tupaia chinensis]